MFQRALASGFSAVVNRIDARFPQAAMLADAFQDLAGAAVQFNTQVSPNWQSQRLFLNNQHACNN
jgi:hypothetical protein